MLVEGLKGEATKIASAGFFGKMKGFS